MKKSSLPCRHKLNLFVLFYSSFAFADEISDFEIEGISIEKSALNYFDINQLEKAKKESVKEEQENLNKTASSLKTTVGVIKQNEISNLFEGLEQASVEADIEIKKKLEEAGASAEIK